MVEDSILAVEELDELKIFFKASEVGPVCVSGVRVGVLGLPYPYTSGEGEIETIEL